MESLPLFVYLTIFFNTARCYLWKGSPGKWLRFRWLRLRYLALAHLLDSCCTSLPSSGRFIYRNQLWDIVLLHFIMPLPHLWRKKRKSRSNLRYNMLHFGSNLPITDWKPRNICYMFNVKSLSNFLVTDKPCNVSLMQVKTKFYWRSWLCWQN